MNMNTETETNEDRMSRERMGNFLAGISVLVTVGLSIVHSRYWLLATVAIACNLIVTAILNRCIFRTIMMHMGVPGERELGRLDALGVTAESSAERAAEQRVPGAVGCLEATDGGGEWQRSGSGIR